MKVSAAALEFAKRWEQLCLVSYKDTGGVWTVGYGHTGPDVKEGRTVTQAEADELLKIDAVEAEDEVNRRVKVPLTQNQFDALWDGEFNGGWLTINDDRGNTQPSTLLRLVNAGDMVGACAEMAKWHHDNGKRLGGLLDRCIDRMRMFRGTPSRLET